MAFAPVATVLSSWPEIGVQVICLQAPPLPSRRPRQPYPTANLSWPFNLCISSLCGRYCRRPGSFSALANAIVARNNLRSIFAHAVSGDFAYDLKPLQNLVVGKRGFGAGENVLARGRAGGRRRRSSWPPAVHSAGWSSLGHLSFVPS